MGALTLLFLLITAATAGEADDARARELYENGAILYEEGRYEDAVVAFEEAYRLSGRPALLFNIANALERAGRWSDALDVLSRYRAYAAADERPTLDRRITNLERRIAEQKAATPETAPTPTPGPTVSPTPTPAPTSPWLRPLPLAVGGGGVLALGAAGVLGLVSLSAHDEAAAGCAPDGAGVLRCSSAAAESLATEDSTALAADLLLGLGLAGIGAGVTLAIVGDTGLVAGPGFVVVEGRF